MPGYYPPPTVTNDPSTPVTNSGGSSWDRLIDALIGGGSVWAAYELDKRRIEDALKAQASYNGRFYSPGQGYGSSGYPGGPGQQAGMFGGFGFPPQALAVLALIGVGIFALKKA